MSWGWKITLLYGGFVTMMVTLVVLSSQQDIPLVRDDYYEHDLKYNEHLTRMGNSGENDILPLMGRRIMSGRDKWQFYTIANNGNLNTKLPVSVNGKSCTGEYGCDDINNSDVVFVEGYNDTFKVTMYENNLFQYIPNL